MSVQAPLFSENMGFPINPTSQDWIFASSSGYGLPGSVSTPLHPFLVNQPANSERFDLQPFRFPSNVLSSEFERQKREIDLFLHLQNEKLKHAIQEQKKQQISYLLKSLESKSVAMMSKIEQDLAEATNRARELEDCLRRAEMETGVWQRMAKENEETIMGLNNLLGQAQERLVYWAGSNVGPAQDEESACDEEEEEDKDKMICKCCRKQRCCIVFLPCRHLCACRDCGSLLETCPVCQSVKQAGIEVFLD